MLCSLCARYKATGGRKLPLPLEVRWNSLSDSLSCYLNNWSKLLTVCEDHRNEIDKDIARLIQDMAVKRNCEDYLKILKPISVALDRTQAAACSIADSVHIWKDLEDTLKLVLSQASFTNKFLKRKTSNLTSNHYLAYLLTPKYAGARLTQTELDEVFEHISIAYPDFLALTMDYKAQRGVFLPYRFKESVVNDVNTMSWWETLGATVSDEFLSFVRRLVTAVTSSASIERVFSTFGLVHSKLRNRLGVEKAGKLVFIYRIMNCN